jgi:hypothetical protein
MNGNGRRVKGRTEICTPLGERHANWCDATQPIALINLISIA